MSDPPQASSPQSPASADPPLPPWHLTGEALAFLDTFYDADANKTRLALRAFVHYTSSPVGPYNEMMVAVLSGRGPTVVQMLVTLEASMYGGRINWGYPKTLEPIEWQRNGRHLTVQARGRIVRARIAAWSFPCALSFFTVQRLGDTWARAPFRIKGRATFACIGKRMGIFLQEFNFVVDPPQIPEPL